jgi:hypothetical protein
MRDWTVGVAQYSKFALFKYSIFVNMAVYKQPQHVYIFNHDT